MLKNIAYKTALNQSDFPDGFITESMETDEDVLEGYTVVPHGDFPALMLNNVELMKSFHAVGMIPQSDGPPKPRNIVQAQNSDEYQQFLAWKNNKDKPGP